MNIHLLSYIIGSIFGIINEILSKKIFFDKNIVEFCNKNKFKCFVNATILNVYGWGFFITSLLHKTTKKYSFITQIIFFSILVGILEVVNNHITENFWGETENHLKHDYEELYNIFDGRTSIESMIYFSIILFVYSNFIIPKL